MIFIRTRVALALTVKAGASAQFPGGQSDDKNVKSRCCFSAHLAYPRSLEVNDANEATASLPSAGNCSENVFAIVQATSQTLWLFKSENHDTSRIWLGLRAPPNTSIVQANFYGDQQGNQTNHERSVVVLARKQGSNDEIWFINGINMLNTFGAHQTESLSSAAFTDNHSSKWANNVYKSAKSTYIQPSDLKVIQIARTHSKFFYVSGCRGVACVLADPNFITFYDLEDADTDED